LDIRSLSCNILHIGYILLLDKFDEPDPEYGTVMARFLHNVQEAGIRTSIDVVSNDEGDFPSKIIPALKYCDYVIINEVEACGIWHLEPRLPDGGIHKENVRKAMRLIAEAGTRERVVVHAKEMGFCLDVPTGRLTELPSLKLDPADIKGSVGAGDAFCAGSLYAIYHQYDDEKLLSFASAVAATSLFEANATDGIRPYREVLAIAEKYQR
jgi:sugar/nucleoside kinase (ribokinase family)